MELIVLVANNTGREARRLHETYPDRIGHIYSPRGWRNPWPIYALDNGAFAAYTKGLAFSGIVFKEFLSIASVRATHPPRWVAVPDVVTGRDETIARWYAWEPLLRPFGWPLAFVVQNGMMKRDVPLGADVVFVGGDTAWKQMTADYWCEHFPRVHVGRVNGERDLWRDHRAGAESCDGTGWFRGDRRQLDGLWYYLADTEGEQDAAHGPHQRRLFG